MVTKMYFLLLVLIMLIGITSCENQSNEPGMNSSTMLSKASYQKDDLVVISKTLVNYLSDKKNQKFIEKAINSSKYVENIMEFSEFLNLTNNEKEGNPTVYDDLIASVPESMNFEKYRTTEFGLIDIYFPYKEHRKKWKAGDDLIVVPVDPREVKTKEEIIGYNLNGNEVNISTENPVDVPTLVITFSEKKGKYIDAENDGLIKKDPNVITAGFRFELRLINIYVKKDYEGWLMGDMEIYVKVKQKAMSDQYFGAWTTHRTWNVAANTSTDITPHTLAWESYSNFEIRIEIWEDDIDGDDFVANEEYTNYRIGTHWGTWSSWYGYIASIPYPWNIEPGDDMQIMDYSDIEDYDCLVIRRWNNVPN